jgi:hypothetical protein
VDIGKSQVRRLIDFMLAVADAYPKEYVDRRLVAQATYALTRAPAEKSKHFRSISGIVARANEVLILEHGTSIHYDIVEGYRLLEPGAELVQGPIRANARRGAACAIKQKKYLDAVKVSDLHTKALRDELATHRSITDALLEHLQAHPLLPPAKMEGGNS